MQNKSQQPIAFTHISFMGLKFNMVALNTNDKQLAKIFKNLERSNWLRAGKK